MKRLTMNSVKIVVLIIINMVIDGGISTAQELQKTYSFHQNPGYSEITGFYAVDAGQQMKY